MKTNRDIAEYLSRSVKRIAAGALRTSIKNPKESAYILKFSTSVHRAEKIRMRYEKTGHHIPAFLIGSICTACNLTCTGCYARANQCSIVETERDIMPARKWNDIFSEARKLGVTFILLAGGEPLIRKDVIEYAAGYPEIIFPVFTNGTMIDKEYLRLFDVHRNLIPLLSIEGERELTDARRGTGIYNQLTGAMKNLNTREIYYGVSITVTKNNIASVTDPSFIRELSQKGCKVVFYIEYVPVTPETADSAPGEAERSLLERQQTLLRAKHPELIFLSFPGDEKHTGGCLAAGRGFFHINADGGAEPCPFSPYSDINVRDHSLLEVLDSPLFGKLSQSGILTGEHSGGCLLFEKEEDVKNFLVDIQNGS